MQNSTPLYPHSAKEARVRGELAQWRESFRANCACAGLVEIIIRENFDGLHLKDAAVKQVVSQFGYTRLEHVLANTVQELSYDERFHPDNKEWAKRHYVPKDENHNASFVVHSHPAVLDGFIREYRKQVQSLSLFEKQHCELDSDLKKSNRKPAERLRFEEDEQRNGRDLSLAAGRGIWSLRGRGDGERTRWNRNEFAGVLKDEFLPDWARENLRQYMPEQTENVSVGRVTFVNGDTQEFTDAEEYLQCIREELPNHPTTGFRYETLTDDPAVRKAVDDALYDLYGEENPRPLEDYKLQTKQDMKMGGI